MTRAEFIQREILANGRTLINLNEVRIRLATELANTLEKSGAAPWDDPEAHATQPPRSRDTGRT
jgi:hypothetical protein